MRSRTRVTLTKKELRILDNFCNLLELSRSRIFNAFLFLLFKDSIGIQVLLLNQEKLLGNVQPSEIVYIHPAKRVENEHKKSAAEEVSLNLLFRLALLYFDSLRSSQKLEITKQGTIIIHDWTIRAGTGNIIDYELIV